MADKDQASLKVLAHLESLGDGTRMADRIHGLVGRSPFFVEFVREDVERLAAFMQIYSAKPGQTIIREGEGGDFMLLVIDGQIDIVKRSHAGHDQIMTTVGPGTTLGEMSMIDGEPRFASCVARESSTFAVLTREKMVAIILEQPSLGAKILIKLVTLLSHRLRMTSARLMQYMEESTSL